MLVMATWLMATVALGEEPVLQLATFRADVTPPIGDGPCVGFMPKVESVEHRLEVRGIVLRANGQTFVIAALDYQGLCNSSDDEFRHRMAERSATRDPKLQEAPEGLIDPWLRTVTFFEAERPIQSRGSLCEPTLDRGAIHNFRPMVQLHYYATHPMSFYGDARISWDVPGLARQRLEQETGVFQIYFTGCGGNIGMGKYNDATRAAREQLTDRMFDAMRRSARVATGGEATETEKLDATVEVRLLKPAEIAWDQADLRFTVRDDGAFNAAILHEQLQAGRPFPERMKAAMFSAWAARLNAGHRVSVSRLKLGSLQLVHLPGEPFVEFQLFAQQVATANSFVCVAGYGECGVWYYGPDSIFRDRGGYEQSWALTGPCQASVEAVLNQLLASPKTPAPRP